jgi:hypothetical protein
MDQSDQYLSSSQNAGGSAGKFPGQTAGASIKILLARPRLLLNPLMLLVFTAAWIRDVIHWLPTDAFGDTLNYWAYTDWLIDYSQGFIRRGLSGEIWRLVPDSVPPLAFTAALSWALILAAAFGYLRLLARTWKALHPLTLFGLLFLPSLFLFYLNDHNAIARKEILGYITVLLHLLVVEKVFPLTGGGASAGGKLRRYVGWLIPIAVILLPAIILVHEGNFLLFVPLHGMITLSVLRLSGRVSLLRAAWPAGLLYLPAALAFAAVYLSGTPEYATLLGVCDKWAAAGALRDSSCVLPPEGLSGSTLPGSFIPMQWSLPKAAGITRFIISKNWPAWLFSLLFLGFSIWYLVRQAVYAILRSGSQRSFSPRSARVYAGLFFRRFFLIPLLFSLPVYFTAYDYGRWLTVTSINFAMLAVSLNLPLREFAIWTKGAGEVKGAAGAPAHLDSRPVFYGVSVLICILALVLILPHFCLFACEIIRSPLAFLSHSFQPR